MVEHGNDEGANGDNRRTIEDLESINSMLVRCGLAALPGECLYVMYVYYVYIIFFIVRLGPPRQLPLLVAWLAAL